MLRLLLVGLLASVAALAQLKCTTYPATGTASCAVSSITFPGHPICVFGAVTNTLAFEIYSTGQDSCPTTFNLPTRTWNYSLTYTSGTFNDTTGAGCWYGMGPEVWDYYDGACPADMTTPGAVCQAAFVAVLGQWVGGIPPAGGYAEGATYPFGLTQCTPANASQTVCACGAQPPPPTCQTGDPVWDSSSCVWICEPRSPIILNIGGLGYDLTTAKKGVWFDFFGNGEPEHLSWTAEGSSNAFLALPRNAQHTVLSAYDLFGNITPQPPCKIDECNGFLALGVFDLPANGGNGDGIIDSRDAVWSQLLLWFDANHNGVSEPNELIPLVAWNQQHPDQAITGISLEYKPSTFTSVAGNQFRFCAPVSGPGAGRFACDVFFVPAQP